MDSFNKLYKSFQIFSAYYLENRDKPKYLLDPISTIIKLAVLKYKPDGTKIRINHHKITYCDPNLLQGIGRWFINESRHSIHHLYLPILYFCWLKFNYVQKSLNDEQNKKYGLMLSRLNDLAIEGIHHLKKTYAESQNDLVNSCLDLYLHLLSSNNESFLSERYAQFNVTTQKTYEEFIKCWPFESIEIIHKLFDEIDKETVSQFSVNAILEITDTYLIKINHSIDLLRVP